MDAAEADEWFPDIAYDPYTGDLYLVYTVLTQPAVVHYRRYDRETGTWSDVNPDPPPPPELPEDGPGYPIHETDHGGWTPRIDVGLWPDDATNTVGVAYSSFNQGDHTNRWHPCIVHWATSEGDGPKDDPENLIPVWNQNFDPTLSSGIPHVDIGPNSNADRYGALTFIQEIGPDGSGQMQYRVYEIDDVLGAFVRVQWPQEPWDTWDTILPSVAIHYCDGGEPHEASVSYFMGEPGAGVYTPAVCRINLDLPIDDPDKIDGYEPINFTASGDWDPLWSTLRINPGLASSIVVREDHGYWAGFCDRVRWDDANPPQMPWVAFGRSDL